MKKLLATLFCLISFAVSRADITGDTFQIQWLYSSSSSVYATYSAIAPGSVFLGSGAGNLTIADGVVTIENLSSGWSGGSFNGFVITDLSQDPGFTSFDLVSQSTALAYLPTTSFTSNSLSVNFMGSSGGATNLYVQGAQGSVATFSFGQGRGVPDSGATVALLGLSLLGVAGLRRKFGQN